MNGHASINRLYRLVWSEAQGGWVAVAENARGRGKSSGRSKLAAALFAGIGLTSGAAWAQVAPPAAGQLPTGGKVAAGSVTISQSGNRMDVNQASQRGAIDWATFNVGSQAQVNFAQPSSTSVTLNRVQDTQASQIFGRITSNGQVFLSNPNGLYFSPTASVDVGGLVATTGTMGTADFMAGGTTFTRNGATGSVVNDGSLTASLGGYIALLAPEVRNNGIVTAQAGTVALASGDQVELQFDNSKSLAGVLVSPSTIAALVENGAAMRAPGGLIIMSAQAADQLQGAVVRNSGTLEATAMSTRGGKIVLDSAGLVDNSGSADVSGTQGGSITVKGDRMLSAGTLRADGTAQGGTITSTLANGVVETSGATLSATGGGSIAIDGGAGQVYSSGTYDADGLAAGQHGGNVTITASQVALMGAHASADGAAGGGTVLVGGDLHGANAAIANAQTTTIGTGVTLSADATGLGSGGKVVVWSDDTTSFAGAVSAKGGVAGGNGGQLEVSGKGTLHFNGTGDASAAHGTAGNLLLDPKDIIIDDQVSSQTEYIDPHSSSAGTFGASVTPLTTTSGATVTPTGYVVITNPSDTLGATDAGAAYLFRQSDHALISTLYGTHASDEVGNAGPNGVAVTPLTNGNFVVGSYQWNGGRGAATWGNGTTGWGSGSSVAVSSANSLVGNTGNHTSTQGYSVADHVGGYNQVFALSTGNYVIGDSGWSDSRGAAAFGNGSTGTSGVISASNALVGSTAMTETSTYVRYLFGDNVGSITVLPNGNYVIDASSWNKGVGAVALGSGTTGLSGTLSASNALVGTTSRSDSTGNGTGTDQLGTYLTITTGSQFIFWTPGWNNYAGEVSWSNGSTMAVGVVSAANSLVGAANDGIAGANITLDPLKSAFLISSPSWSSGKGAVTYVPYGTDPKTISVATGGIVGSTAGDAVGSQYPGLLADGNYVLSSPGWSSGKGAVTVVNGSTGKTVTGASNTISSSNSLVGSVNTDAVGKNGIVAMIGSDDFVAISSFWNNGGTTKVGAVTWSNDTTPTVGAVSTGNSLVGANANDRIGMMQYNVYSQSTTPIDYEYPSVTALTNGNYVVSSPMWNGTRGAVTWGNGSTGTVGSVTSTNSLVGSNVGDYVGSFSSPVPAQNGAPAFFYLGNGVNALSNGNYVVDSDFWKNGSAAHAGAVTWSNGTGTPTVGAVTSSNSLVGSTANDLLGYNNGSNGITPLLAGYDSQGLQLYTGNFVVLSNLWDNGSVADAGAVTWGSGTAATTGVVSNVNSIVGLKASGFANGTLVTPLAVNGNYVVLDPTWNNGGVTSAGAATFVDGSTGHVSDYVASGNKNIVGATNSLVGSHTDDMLSGVVVPLLNISPTLQQYAYSGNYVVSNPMWDNGSLADAGALTWGSATSGVSGTISHANSIVGEKAGDGLGNYGTVTYLPNGNYVVGSSTRDINGIVDAGAASWVDGTTGRLSDYVAAGNQNIVSAANSLVGSHPEDHVGDGIGSVYDWTGIATNSNYFIFSTNWDCLGGAVTYVSGTNAPLIGVVGPSNSAVGDPNGHFVGGLTTTPYPAMLGSTAALVTFGGDGGHVYDVTQVMPSTNGMAIANATAFGDAASGSQMITPGYVANVLKTGTSLTLQASNDILVREGIDATGGTAGGTLTLQAGRSIAVLGSIVTGNRDLTLVANDTVANGVHDAERDAGVATISMGNDKQGNAAVIDAGTGAVSITLSAGADKTNALGGSISLNSITASSLKVVDKGNGLGTLGDLPTLADCCGFTFGTQGTGADIVLSAGATLHATGSGTAVTLAANGKFTNDSGNTTGSIDLADASARWLVYASAPGTSTFGGLDSADTAVWNTTYDPNTAVAATGNRYVFAYQPTVTVSTQNVTKVYGTDLSTGTALSDAVLAVSGAQAAVAGAYLGDTLATAVSGSATATSSGAAATAGVAGGPYAITVNMSGVTGNNGYAVALGSNTPRTLTVTPKSLTAALTGVTKVYDNSNAATLTNANYQLTGLVNGDTFNVGKASGTYNAATVLGASSASTTLASGDFTGQSGTLASNYTLPTTATGSASITPKSLTATLTGVTKTYDGNANATLASGDYNVTGFVGSQSATVTRTSGSYDSPDVTGATSASTTLAGSDFTAGSGTTLSNYTLPTTVTGAASITPKALSTALTGSLGKTYDGTNAETLASANYNVTGFVGSQSATVTQTAATFNSANVASATTVTASLSGADYTAGSGTTLSNYTLPTSASASATITRASLTVTAGNATKTYDGTAWSGGNGVTYAGFVNSQNSSVLGGALTYGGTSQGATNVGGYTIVPGGLTSSNYNIGFVDGTLTINAVQLVAITANLIGNLGKTYDGSNVATLTSANFNLAGFVNGDSATVTKTSGTYDGANAGSHTVTVSLSGSDFAAGSGTTLSNYTLPTVATGSGTIAQKAVTLTAPTLTKTYDGGTSWTTTAGNLTALSSGLVGSDTVTAATLAFTDKNAGAGNRSVGLGNVTVSDGNGGANYIVTLAGNANSTISPRTLTVGATATGRAYDSTLNATVSLTDDHLGSDQVTVTDTGAQFANKNAGVNKTVNVSGLAISGGSDAGNYVLASATTTATATVTPASLAIGGVTGVDRAYDTTTTVALAGTPTVTPFSGDVVTIAGTPAAAMADKNVGTGKTVTVTGYTTTNANYALVQPVGVTVDITPAVLALTGLSTPATRTYDSTRTAALSGTAAVTGLNGEVVSVSGSASGQFADKNVGNAKAVTVSGLTTNDTNYVVGQEVGLSANVTPAPLAVTGLSAVDRSYDSLTGITLSGTAAIAPFSGDVVTLGGTPGASVANKNAGNGKAVTVSGYTVNDSNYVVVQPQGLTVDITPAALAIGGVTAVDRAYDTLTGVALGGTPTVTPFSGDVVTIAGTPAATMADKNVGTGKAVTVSGYTTTNANYALVQPVGVTVDITPAVLALTGLATPATRTYDSTRTAALSGTPTVTGLNGEVVSVSGSASGQFADKNVGNAKAVTVSGLSTNDTNYVVGQEVGLSANVTPAPLAVTGVSAVDRSYDTLTGIALSGTAAIAPFAGDVVTLGGTPGASVANKNAGTGKAVTVSGYTVNDSNYVVVQPQGLTVDIAPAVLALTGLATPATRTYDSTRTAALSGTAAVTGLNGEVVGLVGTASGQFADKNVGSAKTITVSGLTTNDPNYVVGQEAGLSANVTPAPLVVTGVSAVDRSYDTQTGISLTGTATIAPFAGDVVTLGGTPGASVANKNAGTNKAVTVGGYTINDPNYAIVQPQGLTVDIAPAVLALGGLATTTATKTYDGSTTVAISGTPVVTGLNGEVVTVSGSATGQTADKNVGSNKAITVGGLVASDPNYVIGQEPGFAATVTPAPLVVTGVSAVDRAYNTQTGVALAGTATISPIAGDVVTLSGTPTANAADKNAGTNKGVTVAGYTINDPNYAIVQPQGLTVDIAPAVLALGGLATTTATKTYDGSTTVAISGTPVVTGLNGEVVTVSGSATGQTADKNVGSNKAITVGGLVASDPNYVIGQEPGFAATVTPAPLVVTGVSAVDRAYNTQTGVALAGTATIAPIAGDVVTLSGTPTANASDKNAGTGKAVSVGGYTINDPNYALVQPQGVTVTITPAILALGGLTTTAATKTYDGTTTVAISGTPTVSGLDGEVVTVSGSATGQTADKNVGSNKAITVGGLVSSDPNYAIGQEPGLAATVTPAPLVVTGVSAVDRAYNTQTGVALAGTATIAPIGGDVVALSGTPTANASDKNAGTNKAVTVGGYTINDPNYALVQPQGVTVNIAPAVLVLGGLTTTTATKTYDGTTTVAISGSPVVSGFEGEVVTVSGSATGQTADKNVGSNKAITVGGLVSSDPNYAIGQEPGLTATVTPAPLVVTGVTAVDRAYNTQTGVALAGTATIAPIAGDVVTLSGTPTANASDKNAGTNKAVTVGGYTINDPNYEIVQPQGLTVTISPAILALGGLATTTPTKVYDGGTTVAITGAPTVTGLDGEVVTVSGTAVGQTADKNVGSNKAISVSGLVSSDPNYAVGQQAGLAANVTPATLVVTGVTADAKRFDGNASATLSGSAVVTPVAGDNVSASGNAVASFANADVGVGKAVTVTGFALSGADAGNYVVTQPVGLSADITAPPVVPAPVVLPPPALPTPPATPPLATPVTVPVVAVTVAVAVAPAQVATPATPANSAILVSLVREPSVQSGGVVTVSVPKDIASAGNGFSFPMPTQITEAPTFSRAPMTLTVQGGGALPSWVQYDASANTFVVTNVPPGGLPLQVVVKVGDQVTLVSISER